MHNRENQMHIREIFWGTLAYTFVTFPLAAIWHAVIFNDLYHTFGYFDGEPNFVLGFLTILLQGLVLSFLYPWVNFSSNGIKRGVKYSLTIGIFFWTSHVLAFVAKQVVENSPSFVAMESFYLLMQFVIYGVLIGMIYRKVLEKSA